MQAAGANRVRQAPHNPGQKFVGFSFGGASGRRTPHEPHRTADRARHCCRRRTGLRPLSRTRLARHRLFLRFEDPAHNKFALRLYPPLMKARNVGLWIGTVLVAPAVAALVIKLVFPRRKLLMSGRAVVFLIATMILAPGLMANVLLKDHWGRSRSDKRRVGKVRRS